MRTQTIGDLRANIERALRSLQGFRHLPSELQALRYLVPEGAVPEVSLRYRDDNRKIRRSASADYWKPASCQAVITYETEGKRTPAVQRLKPPSVLTAELFRPIRIKGERLSQTVLDPAAVGR